MKKKLSWLEYILLCLVIISISVQLYNSIVLDITYMSYDDAVYTVEALDALEVDRIGMVYPHTGEAVMVNIQRALQSSLVFPAYLSAISGTQVATIEHTVQQFQLILLCYAITVYLAGELFEKRENRLAFVLLVSVFYIFGYHSHYSLTFRLLGPNYQGKAVLAVSLTPLVLGVLNKAISEKYNSIYGLVLFVLSLSAVSLSLWGIGTFAVIIPIPMIISIFRKNRQWKHLLYIAWGCIAPLLYLGYFLLFKYAV